MKMNYILDHDDLQYQYVPLPEDILKMKWSGRLDLAKAMIENRLSQPDLPHAYRARLTMELKNIGHLKLNYRKTKAEIHLRITPSKQQSACRLHQSQDPKAPGMPHTVQSYASKTHQKNIWRATSEPDMPLSFPYIPTRDSIFRPRTHKQAVNRTTHLLRCLSRRYNTEPRP